MTKKTTDTAHAELVAGEFLSRFERRTLDDIRALGGNTIEDERCFAAVAHLSEVTKGLYRTIAQPMVRSLANEQGAELLRRMHPLRMGYEILSDTNPAMKPIASAADDVKKNRQFVADDNLFLQWEKSFSDWMTFSLDAFGQWRDMMTENMFFGIYSQPWVQALLGQRASDGPPRRRPGEDPEHTAFVARRIEELRNKMDQGGPREAAIRAVVYIRIPENAADERALEVLRKIRAEHGAHVSLPAFKQNLRDQYLMLMLDEHRAMETIPILLKGHEAEAQQLLEYIREVVTAGGPLHKEAQRRLGEVEELFSASTLVKIKSPKQLPTPSSGGAEFKAPKHKPKPKLGAT